jgi:hypothetical protein
LIPGGGAGTSAAGQGIESITIPDVGTIRFGGGGSKGVSGGASGVLPISSTTILNLYRLEVC